MIGVGDKVVCVAGFPEAERSGVAAPQVGRVYTVRDIVPGEAPEDRNELFLRFEEIVNPIEMYIHGPDEATFWIKNFRPVKKTKTDISIFQEIDREIFSKGKVSA